MYPVNPYLYIDGLEGKLPHSFKLNSGENFWSYEPTIFWSYLSSDCSVRSIFLNVSQHVNAVEAYLPNSTKLREKRTG